MPDDGPRPAIPRWVDAASDAFYLVDVHGRCVDASSVACERLGYTVEELRRLHVWDIELEVPDATAFRRLHSAAHDGETVSVRGEHRRKDGSTFPVDVRVKRVAFDDREFLVASARDVTQERQLETALRKSEATLRAIFEQAPSYIVTSNLEGQLTAINHILPGLSRDKVIGKPITSFIDPSIRDEIAQKLDDVIRTGEPVSYESHAGLPGGPYRWYRNRVGPVKDRDKITGLVHIADDVSEDRVIREALHKSEAQFRQLVEQLPDGVLVVDEQMRILQTNERAAEALGYGPDQLEGRSLGDIMLDFSPDLLSEILDSHSKTTNFSAFQRRRDDSTFPVEVRASSFEEDGSWRMLAVCRDVSERQTIERAALEAAASERAQIGAVLHDELGQRLAGVRYLAVALAERLDAGMNDQSGARAIVEHVRDAITRVRELARGLAPVGVGAEELRPALEELCASTSRLFGVECLFAADDVLPQIDDPTATGLYQIAREAVTNAVQHAEPQQIDVSLIREKGGVVLTVFDDGVGIPPATERRFGTGIRLMTSRALAIGGTLTVRALTTGTRVAFVGRR